MIMPINKIAQSVIIMIENRFEVTVTTRGSLNLNNLSDFPAMGLVLGYLLTFIVIIRLMLLFSSNIISVSKL